MVIEVDGLRIDIIDVDDRMVLHVANGDGYEPESLQAWARMVKPGRVALDIGAYTGLYAIVAALRGARVVALEPMPANSWRLDINCKLNKVRVKLLAQAASDCNGMATLNYNAKVPLTTGASLESGVAAHGASIEVPTVTIDSLALRNVGAIKLDVERHELSVIRGAMRTIKRDLPPLLIETLDTDMREAIKQLLPHYRVDATLDKRNTLFVPS